MLKQSNWQNELPLVWVTLHSPSFFIYLIQNHAPQVLQEHVHIQLSHAQFKQFVEVCQTQNKVPTRLKQAAQLLDKENFNE